MIEFSSWVSLSIHSFARGPSGDLQDSLKTADPKLPGSILVFQLKVAQASSAATIDSPIVGSHDYYRESPKNGKS